MSDDEVLNEYVIDLDLDLCERCENGTINIIGLRDEKGEYDTRVVPCPCCSALLEDDDDIDAVAFWWMMISTGVVCLLIFIAVVVSV